jgi:hypothetical protein
MMPANSLKALQRANGCIRSALLRLRPEQMHCSTIRPQDFSDLMSEILRAAECLANVPAPSDATALEREMLEYHRNLEQLRDFLPQLHGNLLAEKSRLETARAHIATASAWARSSGQTL